MEPIVTLLGLLGLALGTAGAYWNARIAGKIWLESKAVGGWIRVVAWCGAAQSVIGFSLVYALVIGISVALYFDIDPAFFEYSAYWLSILIVPIALAGIFVITIESWRRWYRDKSLLNLGFAAWNTSSALSSLHRKTGAVGDVAAGLKRGFSRKKGTSGAHSVNFIGSGSSGASFGGGASSIAVSPDDSGGSFGGGDSSGSGNSSDSGNSSSSSDSGGSSDSKDSWKLYLALFVAILVICGGYWTTHAIMKKYMGTDPLPFEEARFIT